MTTLEISEPIRGIVSAPQSSIEHRDGVLALSTKVVRVTTQDELEVAVSALKDLTAITKETEAARKAIKAPIIALGKEVENIAAEFVAAVERDKDRLTRLVNDYQRKQLAEAAEREREKQAERDKAVREAAEAQRQIEEQQREIERQRLALENEALNKKQRQEAEQLRQYAEKKLLESQLAQEDAALTLHASALQVPTNTPRGLVTKVRYDFEIISPHDFAKSFSEMWKWDAKTETLKVTRAHLLDVLNNGHANYLHLLPPEGMESVRHDNPQTRFGIRVFLDINSHVRA